ncbi:unnamed protein product, partial [Pylaiella littoralis]
MSALDCLSQRSHRPFCLCMPHKEYRVVEVSGIRNIQPLLQDPSGAFQLVQGQCAATRHLEQERTKGDVCKKKRARGNRHIMLLCTMNHCYGGAVDARHRCRSCTMISCMKSSRPRQLLEVSHFATIRHVPPCHTDLVTTLFAAAPSYYFVRTSNACRLLDHSSPFALPSPFRGKHREAPAVPPQT